MFYRQIEINGWVNVYKTDRNTPYYDGPFDPGEVPTEIVSTNKEG